RSGRTQISEFPLPLSRRGIDGTESAVGLLAGALATLTGPACEAVARLVVRFPRIKRHARFASIDEEGTGARVESWRPEVCAAGDVRTGSRACFVGRVTREFDRPAITANFFRPRRRHERLRRD